MGDSLKSVSFHIGMYNFLKVIFSGSFFLKSIVLRRSRGQKCSSVQFIFKVERCRAF